MTQRSQEGAPDHARPPSGLLPVSPSLDSVLAAAEVAPRSPRPVDASVARLALISVGVGVLAAVAAQVLLHLIALITNLAFYGRLSIEPATPAGHSLGLFVIFIPMVGGLIIGLLARYGSRAIRGHGIPETMENVLVNQSRIPPRITLLKPLSAAISIGTGGPFGAEGPIIATGGALGSLLGQVRAIDPHARKTLLAAGAAAGMAAVFGAPVSAVLLAVELLLFELRPRSVIPVAFAATTAAGCRILFEGAHAAFPMPDFPSPTSAALAVYVLIGCAMGVLSVGVSRAVYAIEDAFERLPVHWMWWPVLGTFVVGVCGYVAPRTMGVGYDLITDLLGGNLALGVIAWLCAMKFVSWSVSLGSGTSGGTLAPLFIIGGGSGALLGAAWNLAVPLAPVDLRVAALVGMAALFAGASRALLASVVFALEATREPAGLTPLLGGCASAYLISALLMPQSIMTERLTRRGLRVPSEYHPDPLDRVWVRDVATPNVVTLRADRTVEDVRAWILSDAPGASHTGYPVVDEAGLLQGVVTRRDILGCSPAPDAPAPLVVRDLLRRPPIIVYDDCTLREAVDHMVRHGVGRLPVLSRTDPGRVRGIITRSTVLAAQRTQH